MIGTIEQAIIDRIQAASTGGTLGYRLAAVTSYGGELDGDISAVLRLRFPAAWVVYAGGTARQGAGGKIWQARFAVVVAAKGGRNQVERRRGADDKVGAYQLAEDMASLLERQTLGLDIAPIDVGAIRTLFNGAAKADRLAVFALDLTTAYAADPGVDEVELAAFQTFHADWDIPPHGNVSAPLPAADADASDTVTLEQE